MTATALCLSVALALALVQPQRAAPPAHAAADLQAAAQLVESGNLDAAAMRLEEILARGDDAGARRLLGVVLAMRGRLDEAEKELRRALALDPRRLETRQSLARVLLQQTRDADAIQLLRQTERLGPLERDLALRLAEAEIDAGRHAAAERQLVSSATRYKSVQAYLRLARLRFSTGNVAGGRRALDSARSLAPNSEDVLAAYAQSCLKLGKPDQALAALEALVRMHSSVAEYHHLRGVALLQTGAAAAATTELEEANRLEPKRALTLIVLGAALNRRQRFPEASVRLEEGLALEPENVEALAGLARAKEGQGNLAEAESFARRALARDADHAAANLILGTLLMKQGKYGEARDALVRAVAKEPSAKAYDQLSQAYAQLGDETRAREQRALAERAARAAE